MTFSSAVMLPNRRMFWNVRAMPSLVISYRLRRAERLARRTAPRPRSGW